MRMIMGSISLTPDFLGTDVDDDLRVVGRIEILYVVVQLIRSIS
jgi:hypothetical protein